MSKTDRPKVLMIGTSTIAKGGMATVINQLLSSSLKDHFDIKYIATHCDGSQADKAGKAISAFFAYLLYLIKARPEIIHIHSASRASFYRKSFFIIVAKLLANKVIFHLHGGEFMEFYTNESSRLRRNIIKTILIKTDLVIALSNSWEKRLHSILPTLPIKVLPNAITIPDSISISSHKVPVIIFIGRVEQKKGFPDLMAAAEILKSRKVNFNCIICGDGDIKYWKDQCAAKNLSNEFDFKGWVTNSLKHDLLCESDIFVLPSYNEGMPMSVLEAMAYGIPVIATTVGGIPEIINNGVNGFLIHIGDIIALADKLEILLLNKDFAKQIGQAGRQTVQQKFDLNKSIEKLIKIYLSC